MSFSQMHSDYLDPDQFCNGSIFEHPDDFKAMTEPRTAEAAAGAALGDSLYQRRIQLAGMKHLADQLREMVISAEIAAALCHIETALTTYQAKHETPNN